MTIGAKIRETRLAQRRTMKDVAAAVGISSVYLMDIEKGSRLPANGMIDLVCRELGLESGNYMLEILNAKMPPGYRVIREDAA